MRTEGWLARRKFLWREYWARRSRLRAAAALCCAIAAVLVGVLALAPTVWLATMRGWLTTAAAWVGALDPHVVQGVGVAALVVLALVLALAPPLPTRYRRNAIFAGQAPLAPSARSHTLVYLDAENQPSYDFKNAPQQVNSQNVLKLLMQRLREKLDGTRADLLFFMDVTIEGYEKRWHDLYRFGFRLVDVPHNAFDTGGNKAGVVDMELAMQAQARSMSSSQVQHIILIVADQDYIPLIYHLWSAGHTIEVWGDFLPEAFHQLQY